ncbi:MAG TPA: hypothetical protein VK718_12125 [Ferruginibacter sp.]|jgi:hypothetical protein|nr:hypothetical protein [Ferruginibacter sp.]
MKTSHLTSIFNKINSEITLPQYLQEICNIIDKGDSISKRIDAILFDYDINDSISKVDFLQLIFAYIKISLEDGILTIHEREDIKFLKTVFRIQSGDFFFHNRLDVEHTIALELSKIYEDNFITEEEAEFKIGIQEIFDLSFDQMNNYSKSKAIVSIKEGADVKDLDIFFTYDEYFKVRSEVK